MTILDRIYSSGEFDMDQEAERIISTFTRYGSIGEAELGPDMYIEYTGVDRLRHFGYGEQNQMEMAPFVK